MFILLDIDGVMVSAASWKRPEFLNDGFPAFALKSIEALQKIISQTNASILLTTSHKFKYDLPQWRQIFKLRGIDIDKIDRLPDNHLNLNRKEEISNWCGANYNLNESYVIIDDDKSLNALPDEIKENLVLTSPLVGLNDELADQAIFILKQEIFAYA